METYLEVLDGWEALGEDYEISILSNNPTMAQNKSAKRIKKIKKEKAKVCLFAVVLTTIFTRIISFKIGKGIWDYLKKEYEADEEIKGM